MPTSTPSRAAGFAAALAGLLLLDACKEHPGPAAPLASAKPAAELPPAVTAVSGEGSLPVELRFSLAHAPHVGAPFPFSLQISAVTPQPTVRVQVRGDDGMEVHEGAEGTFDRLEPAIPARREVVMQASAPGVHLVTVMVAIDLASGAPARTFTVPVLVEAP